MRLLLLVFCFLFSSFSKPEKKPYHISGKAQGTTFHLSYYAKDSLVFSYQIDSIFDEIDNSLSIYKDNTLISKFNNADSGIKMDQHMHTVVSKSIEIFNKSGGIFDITVYPLVQLWGFGTEKIKVLPDSTSIENAMKCVGTEKIWIEGNRLLKTHPCVKINVNAIAPGYTSDLIAEFLEKKGVKTYAVEVGGELRVKGKKPDGSYMKVGIEGPAKHSFDEAVIQKIIQVKKGAITTAGNYRQYKQRGDEKITHLLDARTGYPLQNELISVTVLAKDAMTADGYDNVLMGLGLKEAMRFVKKEKQMEAYFIYRTEDGLVTDTATTGFLKLLNK